MFDKGVVSWQHLRVAVGNASGQIVALTLAVSKASVMEKGHEMAVKKQNNAISCNAGRPAEFPDNWPQEDVARLQR